jgi:hypothetical protein
MFFYLRYEMTVKVEQKRMHPKTVTVNFTIKEGGMITSKNYSNYTFYNLILIKQIYI